MDYRYADPQESRLERAESVLSDTREALARNAVQIENLGQQMEQGFERVNKTLDKLDAHLSGLDKSLATNEPRISRLEDAQARRTKRWGIIQKTLIGAFVSAAGFLGSHYWPFIQRIFG